MKEDFEVLEYEDFFKTGRKQILGLREKYQVTKDKKYFDAERELKKVMKEVDRLNNHCVPFITEAKELGFIEFSGEHDAKQFYSDALKERLYNFI